MSKQTDAVVRRVTEIRKLEAKALKLEGQAKILRAEVKRLELESISFLKDANLEAVKTGTLVIARAERDVPRLVDFDKFWGFVRRKNAPELMNRSVNSRGWRDHSMRVPGVDSFTRESLSITKRR